MQNVFAYTRVSTVRQGTHGSSLEEQKAAIETYARNNHLVIKAWFEEQETAAKRGRPVFNAMLSRMQRSEAAGVIIHKIDRSARNLRDWADLGELVDTGIEIHLAHESLDMKSRGGRLAADIQAVVAADYIRNLRQEVRKGVLGRLKQGLFPWPAPPGYLNHGGGQAKTIDPVKGPMVKRLFELYATSNYSLGALTREARIMGLKGRDGGTLSKNGISTIFHNRFYAGILVHRPTGEHYAGIHEPLVSLALFERVERMLSGKEVKKETRHSLPYRRMFRCSGCNRFLSGERQKGRVYYRCHNGDCKGVSVREDVISTCLRDRLTQYVLPLEAKASLHSELSFLMGGEAEAKEEKKKARQLAVVKCDERMETLTERYLDGDIERSVYLHRKENLLAEQAEAKEGLALLAAKNDPMGTSFELWFELQDALYQAKNMPDEAELARLAEKACSNFFVEGKNLLVEPQSAFQSLENTLGVPSCGPTRGFVRTFTMPKKLSKAKVKRLAKTLFHLWEEESSPRLRPYVPMSTSERKKQLS